jgi:hypothetical protein
MGSGIAEGLRPGQNATWNSKCLGTPFWYADCIGTEWDNCNIPV